MIEYAEVYELRVIREPHDPTLSVGLVMLGIVDDFTSLIWKVAYYGTGEFEIYARATEANISLLKPQRYVLTTSGGDSEVGIIERIEITADPEEGRMIAASGRMAKSILDRRIIYKPIYDAGDGGTGYIWHCAPKTLSGNVDEAVARLVMENTTDYNLSEAFLRGSRTIEAMAWLDDDLKSKYPETIAVDTATGAEEAEKQVTYKNLLDYTDGLLEEYGLGARLELDRADMLLHYRVYKGVSRSRSNHPEGEPLIFSQEMDNLTSTEYVYDDSALKTTAFIGGEGEGTDRKCAFAYEWIGGMARREVFVDASSITTQVEEGATPPAMEEYRKQLEAQGQQTVSQSPSEETLSGTLDITNSAIEYRKDFAVGDVVTIEDKWLGLAKDVRILTVTEVQDQNGYNIDMEYGDK